MPSEDWVKASLVVQRSVVELEEFKKARRISLYKAFRQEVDTSFLFQKAYEDQKRVSYPRLSSSNDHSIHFRQIVDPDKDLEVTPHGFSQAREACPFSDLKEIDCFVVPAVGFDQDCSRLGMGWGCYDRYFAAPFPHSFKIGIAFDFQIINEPFSFPHDLQCDCVVTEKRTLLRRV